MVVPVGNLVPVAPHVPPDAAAFIEPMSIAVQAIRRSRVTVGEHVVVFGAGPLGQATCLAAQAAGAEVTLAEHAPGRHEWCGGEAPEVVIDTIGTPTALQHTLAVMAHGGRLVTVGQPERELSHYAGLLTNREVDIVTVGCSTHEDLVQAARIVAASVPSILSLISHKVRLDEVGKVLPRVGNPETMKIVVDMSAG
jgi:threonine dehydrogenase-like Zn-dependent dehydrogenase